MKAKAGLTRQSSRLVDIGYRRDTSHIINQCKNIIPNIWDVLSLIFNFMGALFLKKLFLIILSEPTLYNTNQKIIIQMLSTFFADELI
jgi:hypothetical protein